MNSAVVSNDGEDYFGGVRALQLILAAKSY
jgi:hypothetical protein